MEIGPRYIIHDPPEYQASVSTYKFDSGEVMNMFHLEVFYFSASILRQMLQEWQIFRQHCPQVLFCHGEVDDDKFARFIRMFGFQYLRTIPCSDGKERRLFVNYGPLMEAESKI